MSEEGSRDGGGMTEKILLVDDDENLLAGLRRQLGKTFDLVVANDGKKALELAESMGPFAVVVCDMTMPGMNGVEVLTAFKNIAPDTTRIMLTGNADQQTAMDAVNQGNIYRFFTKPCDTVQLSAGINAGLEYHRLVTAERVLLEHTLAGSVKVLTDLLSLLDKDLFGASHHIRHWALELTPYLDLEQPWKLDLAAMLAPIGLVAVPQAILAKQRTGQGLEESEQQMIDRYPEIGMKLISNIPRMKEVSNSILYQNKCFDGSGFPDDSVSGPQIPYESRILKFLNDLNERADGNPPTLAMVAEMKKASGQYCPTVLKAAEEWLGAASKKRGLAPVEEDDDDVIFEVPLKSLLPGHVVKMDVVTLEGDVVIPRGTELSEVQIEHLRNVSESSRIREPIQILQPLPE